MSGYGGRFLRMQLIFVAIEGDVVRITVVTRDGIEL